MLGGRTAVSAVRDGDEILRLLSAAKDNHRQFHLVVADEDMVNLNGTAARRRML